MENFKGLFYDDYFLFILKSDVPISAFEKNHIICFQNDLFENISRFSILQQTHNFKVVGIQEKATN